MMPDRLPTIAAMPARFARQAGARTRVEGMRATPASTSYRISQPLDPARFPA